MTRLFAIILIGLFFLQGCAPLAQTLITIASMHLNRGLDYYVEGHYDLALDEYQQAIDLGPTPLIIAYGRSLRASTYSQIGEYERALQEANLSIETEPTFATSFIGRGYVQLDLEQWQAAIADFERAIALDGTLHQAYLGRAVANVSLDHFDLAAADYRTALTLAPNQPDSEQINRMIATLEKWQLEQLQPASTPRPTLSALCNWFNASQRLRSARIAGSTQYMSFYATYGSDGIARVDPAAASELLAALEEYLPYEREFITAWEQLGSIPSAEAIWINELVAEQRKLAANEKLVLGIKSEDIDLLAQGAEELEAATNISDGAVAGMLEIREQCLAELR